MRAKLGGMRMDFKFLLTSFDGRIGRQQFWIGAVIVAVASIVLSFIVFNIFGVGFAPDAQQAENPDALMRYSSKSGWANLAVMAILAWPALAVTLKRRHDRGSAGRGLIANFLLSAFLLLLQAIGVGYGIQVFAGMPMMMPTPIVAGLGIIAGLYGLFLLIVMGFLRGDESSNTYGPNPLER
jgi:uncharacterized membrane protein YhaH (DUF805 family)